MSTLRRFVKSATARTICQLSVDKVIGNHNGFADRPLIICYHRVVQDFADAATRSMPSLLVSVDMFEKQLDWLARHYTMVSLDEILTHGKNSPHQNGNKGKKLASVTFDEGYADFYWNAFPILKRRGIPASVFVVSDLVGTAKLQTHDELYLMLSQWLKAPAPLQCKENPGLVTDLESALQQHPEPYYAVRHVLASFSQSEVLDILALLREQVNIP
ncbi:MAG: polysaccharide deacetylase family protein, partial [Pseudohongiella sp.]